ncbi:MAG TPA: DUF4433 domain-containing protein [Thermoanaerobaculia bacterium]|jgi:hypothetical protein|nr:DUF4433 domain-containing protein [Thermoanaerobaculia bacterium]
MPKPFHETLTPEKALIFRATHRANVPWTLAHGLQCSQSSVLDPNFVSIGNEELIAKRDTRDVPIPPGGRLSHYIPFYFTPYSPMLYNIRTGYGDIRQRPNEDIVIFVSSLIALEKHGVPYVFTDRHAYLATASFFNDRATSLRHVDFELLQRRDFKRDEKSDPGRMERYQAEALAHLHIPVSALLGLACYTETVQQEVESEIARAGAALKAVTRPNWYFQ